MQPSAKLSLFLLALSAAPAWAEKDSISTDEEVRTGDLWKATTVKFADGTFLEQFPSSNVLKQHWIASKETKQGDIKDEDAKKSPELYKYNGEWKIEEPTTLVGSDINDLGLVLKTPAAHHAISSLFSRPLQFKGQKQVTIQYEVKFQEELECGGAYMKLVHKTNEKFDPKKFTDTTPYSIMFGPDRCGGSNRVHFIFKYKNPKSGKIEEHRLKSPPLVDTSTQKTHLYTLKIFPSASKFELLIDNKSDRKGSLYEDFEPPVVPPKEIDDPNDKKPIDWVDEAKIPDPEATKPDDWDEDAPFEIEDMDAKQPEDWLPNEPEYIPDPEAEKPDDWDDEDDGEWIAPQIPNPKCAKISGCGKWKRPMKKNPAYKGKWTAPLIDNPAYKGVWAPKKIPNPDYFEEKNLGEKLLPLDGVGFELWSMQKDILFDNILITTDSSSVVEKFTSETFLPKMRREQELANDRESTKPSTLSPAAVFENMKPIAEQFTLESLNKFMTSVHLYPVEIIQELPVLAGTLLLLLLIVPLRLFIGLFKIKKPSATPASPRKSKPIHKKAEKEDDEKISPDISNSSSSPDSKLKQRKVTKSEEKQNDEDENDEENDDDDE